MIPPFVNFTPLQQNPTESAVQSFFFFGGHTVLDFDSRGCGQGMRKQLLIFLALFLAMRNGQKRLLTVCFSFSFMSEMPLKDESYVHILRIGHYSMHPRLFAYVGILE